MLYEIILIKRK